MIPTVDPPKAPLIVGKVVAGVPTDRAPRASLTIERSQRDPVADHRGIPALRGLCPIRADRRISALVLVVAPHLLLLGRVSFLLGRSPSGSGSAYGVWMGPFDAALIESVARILGDTEDGLTGTEIGRLLAQLGIDDPLVAAEAQAPPGHYVRLSKKDRIRQALLDQEKRPAWAMA